MNLKDEEKLGQLYTSLWFEHDKKNYSKVKKNYEEICCLLDHKGEADIISEHVANAYLFSDLAELDEVKYKEVLIHLIKAREKLDLDQRISKYQFKWWLNFRHKQYTMAIIHIFIQHWFMTWRLIRSIELTYFLYMSGLAHNKKDFHKTAKWLEKYWAVLLSLFEKKLIPLPI